MRKISLIIAFIILMMTVTPVSAIESDYLWHEEFDSSTAFTDAGWTFVNNNWSRTVTDGQAVFSINKTRTDRVYTDTTIPLPNIEIAGKKAIVLEYKISFVTSLPATESFFVMTGLNNAIWPGNQLDEYTGSTNLYMKDGNTPSVSKRSANVISRGNTYIIKNVINYADNLNNIYIINPDTNEVISSISNIKAFKDDTVLAPLTQLKLQLSAYSYVCNFSIDYMRIYDNEFKSTSTSIDGLEKVSAESEINVTFNKDVNPDTIGNIQTKTLDGTVVESEISVDPVDSRKAVIYYPKGLLYNTNYNLILPDTVKNTAGDALSSKEISFTTEKPPLYRKSVVFLDESNNVVQANGISGINTLYASVDFVNNTGRDNNYTALMLIYDASGNLVKAKAEDVLVTAGETTYKMPIDLSQVSGSRAVMYIWNSISEFNTLKVID